MELEIRPLTPDLLDDYLYFFDNVAFSDHPDWAWCYCTFYHMTDEDMKRMNAEHGEQLTKEVPRAMAADLIKAGGMKGYLAYDGNQVVGWCNAADKGSYKRLCGNRELWQDGEDLRVKSVTCFVVAPGARRQGIAKVLLERAALDAAREDYDTLEAYPATGELDCFSHYHGHPAMYEACGFNKHRDLGDYCIYRKPL